MNKTSRLIIALAIVLVGVMLASALMLKFTPNGSWLAFIGWIVFFLAIQIPLLFVRSTQGGCMAWLARFQKGD